MPKAFEKVWHPFVLFKLRSHGIKCNLFKLLENHPRIRKQRDVIDSQCSSFKNILSVFPRSSPLRPLLSSIHINGLTDGIISLCKMLIYNTTIYSKVYDKNTSHISLDNDFLSGKE